MRKEINEVLNSLEEKMTSAQITEAQKLSSEFKPTLNLCFFFS